MMMMVIVPVMMMIMILTMIVMMMIVASPVLTLEKSVATKFMPSQERKRTTCFTTQAFAKAD